MCHGSHVSNRYRRTERTVNQNWNPADHRPIHVDPATNHNPVQRYLAHERVNRAQHAPIMVEPKFPATQYSVPADAAALRQHVIQAQMYAQPQYRPATYT